MNINLLKIGFCSIVSSIIIVNTALAQTIQQEEAVAAKQEAAEKIAVAKEKMQEAVQKVNEERKIVFQKVAAESSKIAAVLQAEKELMKANHATELDAIRQYRIEKTAELKATRDAVKAEIERKRTERDELKNEE